MKTLLVFCVLIFPFVVNSQTMSPEAFFSNSGNFRIDGYAQLSWTVGDAQVRTLKNSYAVLTQGFLQSKIVILNINETDGRNAFNLRVFPNPVRNILNIDLQTENMQGIDIRIYSQDGKLVNSTSLEKGQKQLKIDFSKYLSGLYLIRANLQNGQFTKTYKVMLID